MDAKKIAALFDNPNFAKWFRDSKAVNERMAPERLYHGTYGDGDFESIVPGRRGAVWLAKDPAHADNNSGQYFSGAGDEASYMTGGRTYPVYASIQNPLEYTFKGITDPVIENELIRTAKDAGHDGIKFTERNGREYYAVFDPAQIKSTFNRGTYDPNDPNILKSIAPYALAGGGLMSALSPSDAAAIESIRQKDAPLEEAWNPVEAFGGGLGGGLRAALAGIIPDGVTDWAINGLMSGGK